MIYPLEGEFLLIRGTRSFLLVTQADACFALCIETMEQEYCQTLEPHDLVAASAPEGGPLEPAVMLIEFVRKYRMPVTVLPRNHPGSKRFSYLVSAGPEIHTSCNIRRGTHPEQHLICSHDELSGMVLKGTARGVEIHHLPQEVTVLRLRYSLTVDSP
ncbi:MAG: alpha/beta hydrolase [Methanoregula sp.]|jgi:hypothetical protein|nr:alpha/beta hydrolase [Methanoregula sp.]